MESLSEIINTSYSRDELTALKKSIFPTIILELPKQVLDSEAAKEVNQKLSEVAFKSGVVKERGLPSMPLVCAVGSLQETQLS